MYIRDCSPFVGTSGRYEEENKDQIREYGQTVFDNFLRSGLHGAEWPHSAYVVFKRPGTDDVRVLENSPEGVHAEIKLIEELKQIAYKEDLRDASLVFYANYTPCGRCADEIISFKDEYNVNFEIVAAAPYMVSRASCRHCKGFSRENEHGLRRLSENKIKVRGFDWNHWAKLIYLMNDASNLAGR